ncbi:anaerobic ribonucleoside-triphosphate reductase activating protein [Peptoniphilus sp. KCTC 25270]|uniref:anaerobic ribonucleoside-triphosphate reductase activating protein n=1 Tax=Peptoniphilus sp. KCTC 25270 TaxID=2897414 RepID=UPI001E34852D|nr:anaerobic ribonucleoside-triphosphate reductase activating protein [Peptoniphilus sp. KCTC 25270]MCD1147823.1 anaerobic ribonucleoside-triphosphate reductase activating protein [Peptoniphilus sp. KCTC 25270]
MKIAQFREMDTANGQGIRSSLFVSGCTHHCKECFNEEYQDFHFGEEYSKAWEEKILKALKHPMISGITFLGGEPMENTEGLIPLSKKIKEETKKNIWIYSGYNLEQILENTKQKELLLLCDVLVDGPFVHSLKDLRLKFRGSSNQRIIDIQKSIETKEIVLFME